MKDVDFMKGNTCNVLLTALFAIPFVPFKNITKSPHNKSRRHFINPFLFQGFVYEQKLVLT